MKLAAMIAQWRANNEYTQLQLAAEIGISKSALSRFEKGRGLGWSNFREDHPRVAGEEMTHIGWSLFIREWCMAFALFLLICLGCYMLLASRPRRRRPRVAIFACTECGDPIYEGAKCYAVGRERYCGACEKRILERLERS